MSDSLDQRPPTDAELDALEADIDAWLTDHKENNPLVDTVERDVYTERAWFIRMKGEAKEFYTVYFHLRQRTLRFETYFMPGPEENHTELFAHLLRRNAKMYGASFMIGAEDAVFIQGQLDNALIPRDRLADELDRVLGSIYQWVEQYFPPAIRIGYASRFTDSD